ncbi:Protein of unknown function [Variovorax sp. YR634]|uniref:MmcB family DNA repair protein n=1 Tax=Variovorax sp. YR634 TaxID=1884385 RepID=UPI00089CCF08|nr:MmcB family DNA repair protein [Variovorax sp. YR634]SDX13903.1 Protein of unknown function [Variovorax sp. YR634]
MKHDELQEDLARHLRAGTDRMVWTNTQLGPSGSPRPDLFTIAKSFARFRADCYEIKVSVSDLRHDLTSGKWQSYRKFGHSVWFAFPRGMAPLELVPKECGVILRSEAGWRAARKPVAQVLDTLPRDAWLKLLMDLHPVDVHGNVRYPRTASEYTAAEILRKRMGDEIADLYSKATNAEAALRWRIERADADRKAIEDSLEQRRKDAEAVRARESERLDASLRDLAQLFGLKEDQMTPRLLATAITSFRNRLRGAGIETAITMLQGLQVVVDAPAERAEEMAS